MPMVTSKDGTQLFARRWGEGPAVVFTHGWASSSEIWQPLMATLADRGFRAIAYDRRGHGRSDDPGRGYDFDTMADDLAAVLEHFGVIEATLVSHSMGAGEIVRYLTRHGAGRVRQAVMVAPSLPYPLKTADNPEGATPPEQFEAIQRMMADSGLADFLGQAVPTAFGPETGPEQIAQTLRMMLGCNLRAAIATNAANVLTDFRCELAEVTIPIQILHGDADAQAPLELTARRVRELAPNARLKVYPGGRHTLPITHVADLADDIAGVVATPARNAA